MSPSLITSNPFNLQSYQNLQRKYQIQSPIRYASQEEIRTIAEGQASVAQTLASFTAEELHELMHSTNSDELEAIDNAAHQVPVVRIVNSILLEAYQRRASDVHLQPTVDGVSLRYRIDGVLYDQPSPPKQLILAIISRIKILAGMNIAEKRLPQDGRFSMDSARGELDIRVATIPSVHGESVSIRLLDKNIAVKPLAELGISTYNQSRISHIFEQTHGMILVTGPTGSGKTTTLYSLLQELLSSERKIVTLEDPVEYEIPGITQTQVQPKIGLSFANGLRSILRHDPDVVLVGEIRDRETAEMAIHASLTGHLVLSSLHTNDAPGAITRLLDMGIEPFLITSSLRAVLAQRLVRLICPNCRSLTSPECEICRGIGFSGRTAISELMICDLWIDTDLLLESSPKQLRDLAKKHGMKSLAEDADEKVLEGFTCEKEIRRVLGRSEVS